MPPPPLPEFRHCAVELIAICRACGYGIRWFARHLGRSPSTVSRGAAAQRRHPRGALVYRAVVAEWSPQFLNYLPCLIHILSLVKPRPLSNWSPFSMLGV
jgi:hypothetical protein